VTVGVVLRVGVSLSVTEVTETVRVTMSVSVPVGVTECDSGRGSESWCVCEYD